MREVEQLERYSVPDTDRDILARLTRDTGPAQIKEPRRERPIEKAAPNRRLALIAALVAAMLASSLLTYLAIRWSGAQPAAQQSAAAGTSPAPAAAPSGPGVALDASGFVVARNKASVSSDITGRIHSIQVDLGQKVRAGDIIAVLDDREVKIRLNAARLQMRDDQIAAENARVQLKLEEEQFRRVSSLSGSGYVSRTSLGQAQAALENARTRLAQTELARVNGANNYESARILVERHVIRAPFAGVIIEVTARPGETVSPTSGGNSFIRTGIVQLVDPNSLYITAEVPERQIGSVRVGTPVEVASAGTTTRSSVAWISPVSNRQRGIIEVGINLPASARDFRDGMEVDVRFLNPRPGAGQAS